MTGQELIERWAKWIRQFVTVTDGQALVLALWAIHTWCYQDFSATPYLEVYGRTKRCGKTTVLNVLAALCRQPKIVTTIRTAPMVRMIDQMEGKLTYMIDEAERLESASLGDTRSMLASGYIKGGMHPVTVGQKVIEFPCFCPKAFASIGNIQPILHDRAIPMEMKRQRSERSFTGEREAAHNEALGLIGELLAVLGVGKRIPAVAPDWLRDREREIWTPLVSIAHALQLHKDTMQLLVSTSVDLGVLKQQPLLSWRNVQDEVTQDERDAAERALADLRSVLQPGERAIWSKTAVDRMRAISTAPWRMWGGIGLNELTLAALLRRYGLQPDTVWIGTGRKNRQQAKGYKVADIHKAQERAGE